MVSVTPPAQTSNAVSSAMKLLQDPQVQGLMKNLMNNAKTGGKRGKTHKLRGGKGNTTVVPSNHGTHTGHASANHGSNYHHTTHQPSKGGRRRRNKSTRRRSRKTRFH